jgi:probable HAF family extracellular repeat protein
MTDLGTLGGDNGFASGVNAAGDVVGKAQTGGNAATHAFLVQNGSMSDLGTLGGTASGAADINAAGRIVGSSDIAGNAETHAFIHEAGVMRDLGTLGGSESRALAVNDAGHVVGSSFPVGSTDDHAFFYRDGQMVDLYPGGSAIARGLNNRDHVVGRMRAAASPTGWHAFRYCGGTVIDLNQLLPAGAGLELVDASDINDSGAIVGVAVPASSTLQRAYMLTPS